jgi:dTDP-4-dehydrorhamnose reductase
VKWHAWQPTPAMQLVRASSIYGFGLGRVNFAKFLFKKLSENKPVKALIDQYTTPTQATLLAQAIMEIIDRKLTGIFHIVGEKNEQIRFCIKSSRLIKFR